VVVGLTRFGAQLLYFIYTAYYTSLTLELCRDHNVWLWTHNPNSLSLSLSLSFAERVLIALYVDSYVWRVPHGTRTRTERARGSATLTV